MRFSVLEKHLDKWIRQIKCDERVTGNRGRDCKWGDIEAGGCSRMDFSTMAQ
jgi:hypothetical protein